MEDEKSYDGSLVLEKLAEAGRLEEFNDAIDEDDFLLAKKILRESSFPREVIQQLLQEMLDTDG